MSTNAARKAAQLRDAQRRSAKLVAVKGTNVWDQIEFTKSGVSFLSSLLSISGRLPRVQYDDAPMLDIDAGAKASLLAELEGLSYGLNNTVAQIGKLMAMQDSDRHEDGAALIIDLGFTIAALAEMAENVMRVRIEIEDAEPRSADDPTAAAPA